MTRVERARQVLRAVLGVGMMGVGVLHFTSPEPFARIVPDALPAHVLLVYVSGFFEVLGGLGLLLRRSRRYAGYGLIALYVAVFPANVNMAVHHIQLSDSHLPSYALWLRLPLQAVLVAWAYWASRDEGA